MSVKKAELPVADLRDLSAMADSVDKSVVDKWLTPEFWTMATTVITNLLAVAVLIGWISAAEVEGLTKALTGIITAAEVIVVNSALVWKFLAGRNELKAQLLDARYRYVETVAVERLRAAK